MKPELLAPAGDLTRLKIAFKYGADAVYIGGSAFSLRANADNFTLNDIKQAVQYAHKIHKKIYVTVNIIMHNKEIKFMKDYLMTLDKIGVDAIIVSDLAILSIAKQYTNLEIHISTQLSSLNKEAINYLKKMGASRIVLARECNKEDIQDIKNNVNIELEMFIHGAMCASYSGRCVLSNYLTNRDANRGGCAQICRWDFDLYDNNKLIKEEKPFTFCTKDLSLMKYIPDLINMKVDSFKIEGRMRSVYYLATVVKVYRHIIDQSLEHKYTYNQKYETILRRCANRDSISQFFDGNCGKDVQYYNGRMEVSNQDFLGIVLDYNSQTHLAKIEQRNYFKKNDVITIFGPNYEINNFKINEIFDEDMNMINVVRHPRQIIYLKIGQKLQKDDILKVG